MNAKTRAAVTKHGENLLTVFPNAAERDPVNLCRKVRRLEREGEAIALRQCNGPEYEPEELEEIQEALLSKLDALLGFRSSGVPVFLNGDPRGYALKIESAWMLHRWEMRMHTDFGGYGIIAPDLTERS